MIKMERLWSGGADYDVWGFGGIFASFKDHNLSNMGGGADELHVPKTPKFVIPQIWSKWAAVC